MSLSMNNQAQEGGIVLREWSSCASPKEEENSSTTEASVTSRSSTFSKNDEQEEQEEQPQLGGILQLKKPTLPLPSLKQQTTSPSSNAKSFMYLAPPNKSSSQRGPQRASTLGCRPRNDSGWTTQSCHTQRTLYKNKSSQQAQDDSGVTHRDSRRARRSTSVCHPPTSRTTSLGTTTTNDLKSSSSPSPPPFANLLKKHADGALRKILSKNSETPNLTEEQLKRVEERLKCERINEFAKQSLQEIAQDTAKFRKLQKELRQSKMTMREYLQYQIECAANTTNNGGGSCARYKIGTSNNNIHRTTTI